jgi:hypothetical protein
MHLLCIPLLLQFLVGATVNSAIKDLDEEDEELKRTMQKLQVQLFPRDHSLPIQVMPLPKNDGHDDWMRMHIDARMTLKQVLNLVADFQCKDLVAHKSNNGDDGAVSSGSMLLRVSALMHWWQLSLSQLDNHRKDRDDDAFFMVSTKDVERGDEGSEQVQNPTRWLLQRASQMRELMLAATHRDPLHSSARWHAHARILQWRYGVGWQFPAHSLWSRIKGIACQHDQRHTHRMVATVATQLTRRYLVYLNMRGQGLLMTNDVVIEASWCDPNTWDLPNDGLLKSCHAEFMQHIGQPSLKRQGPKMWRQPLQVLDFLEHQQLPPWHEQLAASVLVLLLALAHHDLLSVHMPEADFLAVNDVLDRAYALLLVRVDEAMDAFLMECRKRMSWPVPPGCLRYSSTDTCEPFSAPILPSSASSAFMSLSTLSPHALSSTLSSAALLASHKRPWVTRIQVVVIPCDPRRTEQRLVPTALCASSRTLLLLCTSNVPLRGLQRAIKQFIDEKIPRADKDNKVPCAEDLMHYLRERRMF